MSRINNDLLVNLKKEQKQEEKIKSYKEEKIKQEMELQALLKEAEDKRREIEESKKEDKKRLRAKLINEDIEKANLKINDLRYNEGIIELKKIIDKLSLEEKPKYEKQINKQIEILENASQVPLITINDIVEGEDLEKFELSYHALDKAQISLSQIGERGPPQSAALQEPRVSRRKHSCLPFGGQTLSVSFSFPPQSPWQPYRTGKPQLPARTVLYRRTRWTRPPSQQPGDMPASI